MALGPRVVQVLMPYAAHMAPEHARGRVVGNVMSGTLIGIMLARPVSSFLADLFSWHAVFVLAAGAMIVLAAVLSRALPQRVPMSKRGDHIICACSPQPRAPHITNRAARELIPSFS